jgi:hypothetical protein
MDNPDPSNAYFSGKSLDYVPGEHELLLHEAEPEAYVATLAVGALVARVFLFSPLLQRSGILGRVSNGAFDRNLVPVWLPGTKVSWPPMQLNLQEYARLADTEPQALVAR